MTERAPLVISALVGAAGILWAAAIGANPEPLAASSAFAIAIGFVLAAVIAVTAILLVRAPLGRWIGLGLSACGIAALTVFAPGALGWFAVAVSAAAIVGLTGPWLDVWLRGRPTADDLGWQPPALILGSVGLVPLVGIAAPDGLQLEHGLLAGAGLFFGWGYARAELWGLWGLRLALLPAAVLTLPVTPRPAGAVAILAAAAVLTGLAWSRPTRRAIGIPAPVLPAPHRRRRQSG